LCQEKIASKSYQKIFFDRIPITRQNLAIKVIVTKFEGTPYLVNYTMELEPFKIPNVIRHYHFDKVTKKLTDAYVGGTARQFRETLQILSPVKRGIITDWSTMETMWSHIFENDLAADPKEHLITMLEIPGNPKENREKMVEILMETFGFQGAFVANTAAASLFGRGKTTGVVLTVGEGVTMSIPVCEAHFIPHAMMKLDLSGKDLTDYLR
jgi:actin-related protein